MIREPASDRYRRARMLVLTLGYSRKSVRLLTFRSSTRIWAELHERAFRRLGGVPRVVVLDNLGEGVLAPDIKEALMNMGTLSPNPWDLALSGQHGLRGADGSPRHSGPWVGLIGRF